MKLKQAAILCLFSMGTSQVFFAQSVFEASQKQLSDKINQYKEEDHFSTNDSSHYDISIVEGPIQTQNKNGKTIADGGFTNYIFRSKEDNKKLLKSVHQYTIHNTKTKSQIANSQRVEMTIFYDENENPDLAKINEGHYTNTEILSSNLYYLNLPKNKESRKNITYSYPFSEEILTYIFNQAEAIKTKR